MSSKVTKRKNESTTSNSEAESKKSPVKKMKKPKKQGKKDSKEIETPQVPKTDSDTTGDDMRIDKPTKSSSKKNDKSDKASKASVEESTKASDSQSGEEKTTKSAKKPSKVDTKKKPIVKNDEEVTLALAENKNITVKMFKGKPLIDIREYYNSEGTMKPGKKGIAINVEQWETLKKHMNKIDEVLKRM